MQENRQSHLDAVRGAAATIVVLHHFIAAYYPYAVFAGRPGYSSHAAWETIFSFPPFGLLVAGNFSVCIFFILSGFVLSWNGLGEKTGLTTFLSAIVKRPIRLGGIVVFTILISSLLWKQGLFYNDQISAISQFNSWLAGMWGSPPNWREVALDVSLSPFESGQNYNAPLWTIQAELYGSFAIYIYVFVFGNQKYRLIIPLLLLFFFRYTPYQGFIFGVIIADLIKNYDLKSIIHIKRNATYTILIIVFLIFSSFPAYYDAKEYEGTIYNVIKSYLHIGLSLPMIGAVALFILVSTSTKMQYYLNNVVLLYLGRISYSMYALHFLVLGSASGYVFLILNIPFGYNLAAGLAMGIGIVMTVLLSHISTRFVDEKCIKIASSTAKLLTGVVARPYRKKSNSNIGNMNNCDSYNRSQK